MSSNRLIPVILIVLVFTGCTRRIEPNPDTLRAYINSNPDWFPFNELIACATGNENMAISDEDNPISLFYYPKLFSTNFRYYETDDASADPMNLSEFEYKDVPRENLFNGFMSRFIPEGNHDRWVRVSYLSNDTLWYCKPVLLKYQSKPTELNPDLCEIDTAIPTEPVFTWTDGIYEDNIIYFQVVSDVRGDALSATYTYDQQFQYYNTENVVLNVTRPGPVPELESGEEYMFTLMGVSSDNWVNLFVQKDFTVE